MPDSTKLYQNYAETKISDLYTRMGNAVLRELRDYDKALHPAAKAKKDDKKEHAVKSSGMYNLKKALRKDYSQARNRTAFQALQRNIEQEQEQENER